MPSEDLKQYVNSELDFYALLNLTVDCEESEIHKAWRRTALKHHPDKNPDDESAAQKFHNLTVAREVLCDPTIRSEYDNVRTARLQRKKQTELLDKRRQAMMKDLEMREQAGWKRRREEEEAKSSEEIKLRRLAEEGRQRRKAMDERKKRESLDAAALRSSNPSTPSGINKESRYGVSTPGTSSSVSSNPTPRGKAFQNAVLQRLKQAEKKKRDAKLAQTETPEKLDAQQVDAG